MRTLLSIVVLLALAAPADARQHIATGIPHPRGRGSAYGLLNASEIGTRSDAVLGTFETSCPHTSDGNPTILVLLDPDQPVADGAWIATDLAVYGYTVVVLHPRPLPTSAQLGAMLDAIAGGVAATPLEPGCTPDGKLGVYGELRAGAVVLATARDREAAGHPLDIAIAVLAGPATPPDATATLLVEGARREPGNAVEVVVTGLTDCQLHVGDNPCWRRLGEEHELAVERQLAFLDYVTKFLRGMLDGDDYAIRAFRDPVIVRTLTRPASSPMWGEPEWRASYSVPMTYGVTFTRDGVTSGLALRPEVLALRVRDGLFNASTRTFGIGVYGELASIGTTTEYGTGVTMAFGSGRLGIAPSLGYTRRGDDEGVAGSLFFGVLDADDLENNNLATGFRIDARHYGNEMQVTAAFQIDLAAPVIAVAALVGLLDKASHH